MKAKTHSDKREEFLQTIRLLGGGMPNETGCLSHDWYQYNPPFTPWFLRRKEILIPVERS